MSEATIKQDTQGRNCPHCDEWIDQPEDPTIPIMDCPGCGAEISLSAAPSSIPPRVAPRAKKSRGALNVLLCLASVAVILSIYGFSIFQAKTRSDEITVVPAPPVAEEPLELPADIEPTTIESIDDEIPVADLDAEEPMPKPADDVPTDVAAFTDPLQVDESEETELPDETPPVAMIDDQDDLTTIEDPADAPAEAARVDDPPPFDEQAFLDGGWKSEASEVLRGFITATSLEDRITYVMDPERVKNAMQAIEQQDAMLWQELSLDDFKHIELPEADRRRGIFLMLRETPGDDPDTASGRSYAFFKRTNDGLKLDFEIFSQTTGQSFDKFIEAPQPGVSKIFRVFITEDPESLRDSTTSHRAYFVAGLSNFSTATRIRTTTGSPVGRILNAVNFTSEDGARRIMRNATVELRWTDHPDHSSLELSKFICWEFLGLGGQRIHD